LGVEDQERQAAEVIAVKVAQEYNPHLSRVHAVALHADQRRGAAVDEHGRLGAREVQAGLQPATSAEGVARAHEAEGDGHLARFVARKARTCFSASSWARGS